MVGQKNLSSYVRQLIADDVYPCFSIFIGERGSEKEEFGNLVAECMNATLVKVPDVKIDTIRNIIVQSYKTFTETVYLIPDADGMSVQAKNALLKVTEEPPNNSYFVMTLEDTNNTLDTIRSRAVIFYLERYTMSQLLDYAVDKLGVQKLDANTQNIITGLCDTPGEIDLLNEYEISQFYDYVNLVVNNICKANIANALKISDRISLKTDTADKYDLKLFWKAFMHICGSRILEDNCYIEWARITSKSLTKLNRIKGINKQMLFDNWVFDIREWS